MATARSRSARPGSSAPVERPAQAAQLEGPLQHLGGRRGALGGVDGGVELGKVSGDRTTAPEDGVDGTEHRHRAGDRGGVVGGGPARDRHQVVALGRERVQRRWPVRPVDRVVQARGQGGKVVVEALPRGRRVTRLGQAPGGKGADTLEQPQARGVGARRRRQAADQRLVAQRVQDVEHRRGAGARREHGLRRRHGEAAAKERALGQRRLLVRRQQVPRPGDGALHGGLPFGRVARAAAQHLEPFAQAGEKLARSQDLAARGGQLDRQRDAVELAHDLGDHRPVGGGQLVARIAAAAGRDPEAQRLAIVAGVGQRQRR